MQSSNSPVIAHGGFLPDGIGLDQLGKFGLDGQLRRQVHQETEEDKAMLVQFFDGVEFMGYETSERGYPVFKPCECVTIYVEPGRSESFFILQYKPDKFGNLNPTEVTRFLTTKYASRYEAYKKSKEGKEGTPFNVLPKSDIGLTATLISLGIDTLEKLVSAKDEHLFKIEGAVSYKKQAKAFLELSTDAMLEAKNHEIEQLKAKLAQKTKVEDVTNDLGDGAGSSRSKKSKPTA